MIIEGTGIRTIIHPEQIVLTVSHMDFENRIKTSSNLSKKFKVITLLNHTPGMIFLGNTETTSFQDYGTQR